MAVWSCYSAYCKLRVTGHFNGIMFIHSIGMCRIRRFLAVLRSFFHFSLLCTFSCHPSPPTILPSSLISSCHLFLDLVVSKFIYYTLLGNGIIYENLIRISLDTRISEPVVCTVYCSCPVILV